MIKELIEDLAFDKITLSQGLTRAKIITSKIQNAAFKQWINKEFQGYTNDDTIPNYREIACQTSLVISLPFGGQDVIPLAVTDPDLKDFYNLHKVFESITFIESTLNNLTDKVNITIQLPSNLAILLADPFKEDIESRGGGLRAATKKFGKAAYQNIIESTKQKLLDTLLELNQQFPDLENEFMATKENVSKVNNIVTNNIWGNNNPINIAAGQEVTQKDITNNINFDDYSKLEKLGVEEEQIEELKAIVNNHKGDKSTLQEKTMKWVTPVITGVVSRGLYEYAPQIMDFVIKLAK